MHRKHVDFRHFVVAHDKRAFHYDDCVFFQHIAVLFKRAAVQNVLNLSVQVFHDADAHAVAALCKLPFDAVYNTAKLYAFPVKTFVVRRFLVSLIVVIVTRFVRFDDKHRRVETEL